MIGLGLSVVQLAVRQLLGFSPKSLFANSEPGVWYDPSDFSTMFQDAAGTTPVTAVEQPVGRILDKSGRGFHATQTTATSRPVLSARYNLLTKTEQFDDSYWTKTNVTVTANTTATADPLGGNTADTLTISTTNTFSGVARSITTANSRFSVYVKPNGFSWVALGFGNGAASLAYFNIVTGQIGSVGSGLSNATIAPAGDGWYQIGASWASANFVVCYPVDANNSFTATASGTSGIYIWGASLVPANQASLPYQRVNTATDYDADPSKFKPYLRFDGVDDWLVTPTITPGTDKVQVFAGVRKIGTTGAIVVESGVNANNTNGSIYLAAPDSNSPNYGTTSRGTVARNVQVGGYTSPATHVLTSLGDISGDSLIMRVNSEQKGANLSDQGTGNFLAYPLYIGRRGGTTMPFNGQLYSLIVRFGANLPAGTIASTESWVNGKTGAY